MKFRFQPWHLAALVILLCVGLVTFSRWRRVSRPFDGSTLIQCLPPDQATHLYIDFDALRRSGLLELLAGSKAAEETDYRRFVEETHFDYRTDLDALAAAFFNGNVYFTARCRYDWKRLANYAQAQGGSCHNTICTMVGSKPNRHISFYPLKSDVLALAVSSDERGVNMIGPSQWKNPPHLAGDPVWISAPGFMFMDANNLPAGTHSFFTPLAQAQEVTFTMGPQGQRLEMRLEVICTAPEAAAALAKDLTKTTDLLKKMLEREHLTPNSRDLSGVLVAGTFEQKDRRVVGIWPIERGFVEALAAGQIQ